MVWGSKAGVHRLHAKYVGNIIDIVKAI